MKKKGIVYAILILALAASFLLLFGVYILKSQFVIDRAAPQHMERIKIEDGKMLVETDINGFNGRILDFCAESVPLPQYITVNDMACIFKEISASGEDELYINLTDGFNTPYSFKCGFTYKLEVGAANISVTDIRLGKYEIPLLGQFLWRFLNMPEEVSLQLKQDGELRYLSAIDIKPNGTVILTYDYDAAKLVKAFEEVLSDADERKIEFHRGTGRVDIKLLEAAEKKSVSYDEALVIVGEFEKTPDSFLSLCYVLNNEGISKLYTYFGEDYYKYVNVNKLIEASENEIDSGLNEFHKRFSRQLLQYLYRNPDYIISDGSLYLNGNKIAPETILQGIGDTIYDIEIWANENSITAKYTFAGHEVEKIIINEIAE